MSFQGTRDKSGAVDLDRSAVGRGIAVQVSLGILAVGIGSLVDVAPGFLLLPTTLIAGGYVGLRSDNWGDEYMDGAAMGVVGGIVAAGLAGVLAAAYALLLGGGTPVEAFLSSMVAVGLVVVLMSPLLGVFGALSAWYVARQFRGGSTG